MIRISTAIKVDETPKIVHLPYLVYAASGAPGTVCTGFDESYPNTPDHSLIVSL